MTLQYSIFIIISTLVAFSILAVFASVPFVYDSEQQWESFLLSPDNNSRKFGPGVIGQKNSSNGEKRPASLLLLLLLLWLSSLRLEPLSFLLSCVDDMDFGPFFPVFWCAQYYLAFALMKNIFF